MISQIMGLCFFTSGLLLIFLELFCVPIVRFPQSNFPLTDLILRSKKGHQIQISELHGFPMIFVVKCYIQ